MTGYIDFSYPVWLVNEVKKQNQTKQASDTWWLSQPRLDKDGTIESLTITFQSLVSLSELSFELLQVGCEWEVWYLNKNRKLVQVMDRSGQHLKGRINHSKRQTLEWGKYTRLIHPVTAHAVELRLKRVPASLDYEMTQPYSVGVRDFYGKRNIFSRDDATRPFEDEVDLLGNLVSKTVVDWDSNKAIDGKDFSFWKSGPQPSPDAVVNYYVDCHVTKHNVEITETANLATRPVPQSNSGASDGSEGWAPVNATRYPVSYDPEVTRRPGGASVRADRSTSTLNNTLSSILDVGSDNMAGTPVKEGDEYTFSVYVSSAQETLAVVGLYLFKGSVFFSTVASDQVPVSHVHTTPGPSDDDWTRVHITTTIPAGVTSVRATVSTNLPQGEVANGTEKVWFTDAMLTEGNDLLEYFDGDSDDAQWTGAPHASTSVQTRTIGYREEPQAITSVYIDPVFTGQDLNIYYSNDEHVGRGKLSNHTLPSDTSINALWKKGIGITLPQSDSKVTYNLTRGGFEQGKDFWLAVEFSSLWGSDDPASYTIMSMGDFKLETSNGKFSLFTQPANFPKESQFLAVFLSKGGVKEARLYTKNGQLAGKTTLSSLTNPGTTLNIGQGIRLHSLALQQGQSGQEFENSLYQYASNSIDFLDSDLGDDGTSTLNDIIIGGDLRLSEHPRGGLESVYFDEKTWIPVWKDYVVRKGKLILPKPVLAKYLKFEFSNLTEQPYPIWESGIETKYKTYPISVSEQLKTVSTTQKTVTTTKTSRSDSNTVQTKTTSFTTSPKVTSTYDVQVSVGRGNLSNVLNTHDRPIQSSLVTEVADSTLYKRQTQSSRTLSKDKYYTIVSGDWLIKIGKKLDIPWTEIYNANRSMIDNDPRVKLLPKRSPGWWIFPGQKLKISSKIMETITKSEVKTERKQTTLARKRFETTSIHRYDIQTVKRDAAIAYFAGIREIKLYTTNYITQEDSNYVIHDMTKYFHATQGEFEVDDELGIRPITTPMVLESETFPSLSPFRRLSLSTYDRGLQRPFVNLSSLRPIGTADGDPTWSSMTTVWDDPVSTWGASEALSSVSYQGNYIFDGYETVRVVRRANPTDPSDPEPAISTAGLRSPNFNLPAQTRWRLGGRVYRTSLTGDRFIARLKDNNGVVVFEEDVYFNPGEWVEFKSKFNHFTTALDGAFMEFVSQGVEEESFFVHSLFLEATTTVWEASNDGGQNFYEVTDVIYPETNYGFMQFPTSDNKLKFKVTTYGESDYLFGFEANPKYEADSPPHPIVQ